MTEQELNKLTDDITDILRRRINFMASEMRNDRNDGWVQLHYRDTLRKLRDHINKHLEGSE
jgi:hypothetical protein